MKRVFLFVAMSLLIVTAGFAQKSKRTSAYMYLGKGQLEKAKIAIDQAVKNPKTMNDAKTWLYYGRVYYGIATSQIPAFQKLDTMAAEKALAAFVKAKKLDKKKHFQKEADNYIASLSAVFYKKGANDFKDKDYVQAMKDFGDAYKVAQDLNKIDTVAAFNLGISAVLAKKPKIASEYLKKCVDLNFKDPKVFIYYTRSLKQLHDTAAAEKAIQLGRDRFPNNLSLLLEQAQIFLEQGLSNKLIQNLKEAIAKDPNSPNNANFYFLIGKSYDDLGDRTKAEEYYKKSLEVKPNFFEAYYNIGAIYVNKAALLQKQANNLPLDKEKEYKALNTEANQDLEKAMPWLEKALKIRPKDGPTVKALKEVYTRLKMYDKLKELNKQ